MSEALEPELVNGGAPLKIAIAIPSYRGFAACDQTLSIVKLAQLPTQPPIQWTLIYSKACGVLPRVRNALVASALSEGCSHVLFIDDDIAFKPEDVLRMIGHDVGVVAAVPQKRVNKHGDAAKLAVHPDGLRVAPEVGLAIPQEPKAPMALTLIKAEVFHAIAAATDENGRPLARRFVYPLVSHDEAKAAEAHKYLRMYFGYQVTPCPKWSVEYQFARDHLGWPEEDIVSEDGEDHYFCRLADRVGYPIYLDLEIELTHFEGNVAHDFSFKKLLANGDASLREVEVAA